MKKIVFFDIGKMVYVESVFFGFINDYKSRLLPGFNLQNGRLNGYKGIV
jgi:hypothetical protein